MVAVVVEVVAVVVVASAARFDLNRATGPCWEVTSSAAAELWDKMPLVELRMVQPLIHAHATHLLAASVRRRRRVARARARARRPAAPPRGGAGRSCIYCNIQYSLNT